MKSVKDLDLKTSWFDNINDDDDIKVVNDIKDLDLKVKRLRMSRAKKKLIIKSKFNERKRRLNLKFKIFLLSYILNSVFDNIIIIALSNRMLNNLKFNTKIII